MFSVSFTSGVLILRPYFLCSVSFTSGVLILRRYFLCSVKFSIWKWLILHNFKLEQTDLMCLKEPSQILRVSERVWMKHEVRHSSPQGTTMQMSWAKAQMSLTSTLGQSVMNAPSMRVKRSTTAVTDMAVAVSCREQSASASTKGMVACQGDCAQYKCFYFIYLFICLFIFCLFFFSFFTQELRTFSLHFPLQISILKKSYRQKT